MTRDAAQAAIERAWDARTDQTRAKHARLALAADPDALDGYVLLAQSLTADAERPAILREGAQRGRRLWAAEMKAPARHGFWLDLDTRPFLRALHLLALALWDAGDRAGAIGEAKTLLRLNRAAMGYVTMGSPAEAKGYADFAREAWLAVDGAIDRLTLDVAGRQPRS